MKKHFVDATTALESCRHQAKGTAVDDLCPFVCVWGVSRAAGPTARMRNPASTRLVVRQKIIWAIGLVSFFSCPQYS